MKDMTEYRDFRAALLKSMSKEILGPAIDDAEEDQEEILDDSPLQLYGAGILFPQRVKQELMDDTAENQNSSYSFNDRIQDELDSTTSENKGTARAQECARDDEPLNLANQYCPSALGITFKVKKASQLNAIVSFGTYKKETSLKAHPRAGQLKVDGTPFPETVDTNKYHRTHHLKRIPVSLDFTSKSKKKIEIPNTEKGLWLHVLLREANQDEITVSLMLVNHFKSESTGYANTEKSFFQTELSVTTPDDQRLFCNIERPSGTSTDEELASMALLYRHKNVFALGHGCSGDWKRDAETEQSGHTNLVKTAIIPTYEVQPVLPRESSFSGNPLKLQMALLAGDRHGNDNEAAIQEIAPALSTLCDDYQSWIDDLRSTLAHLPEKHKEAAERHIKSCEAALKRMREGIQTLTNVDDPIPLTAFRIANKAMLMQQVHTGFKARTLDSEHPHLPPNYLENDVERKWRPFQLAFFLMNIAGGANPDHGDREIADLIWFPTGGGKTEAYLGVAAYVIALRRLRSPKNAGTAIIMRYTLRLLTAQQFQRASALIICMDYLRKTKYMDLDLGSEPISIGLWVGRSLSPNTRQDALQKLSKLRTDRFANNPFQVLNCPWCGCEMNNREKLGYTETRLPGVPTRTVELHCPDQNCFWGNHKESLPITVIDEDIYSSPPTLLLGTVDKFAQVAWKDEVGQLFGIGTPNSSPELIIQDELHLISGPLGTIVGLYEMVIDRLCSQDGVPPKVIASTATIRNAEEQCKALFKRQSFEFPPQGLKAGDSYFAYENDTAPGRLYAGVFGSGFKSHATSQVRTCAALLQGAMPSPPPPDGNGDVPEIERGKIIETVDPYGTLVWYFNSLRELGHATTMCSGDIPEHFKSLCRRGSIPWSYRRKLHDYVELTSRRTADEIPSILKQLEIPWAPKPDYPNYPVDVLLATNMISVGVDVSRLGLMVVTGQPKSTSEYIQATSRVGRRYPGLVVTNYNQSKSRDRSHYEQFIAYHQSFYRFVEATSITPFSPPARDRALKAVLVAVARLVLGATSPSDISTYRESIEEEFGLMLDRIKLIDEGEADSAAKEFYQALAEWEAVCPSSYGGMAGSPDTTTLVFPYGSAPHPEYQKKAWPILTSMRNVDGTAAAMVISDYPKPNDDQTSE